MSGETKIYTLKAREFKIASVTMSLSQPRMFILFFFHKDFPTLVRVRAIFKRPQESDLSWPEFKVETVNSKYEVLEAAKKTFEMKTYSFIRRHYPYYSTGGQYDQTS